MSLKLPDGVSSTDVLMLVTAPAYRASLPRQLTAPAYGQTHS